MSALLPVTQLFKNFFVITQILKPGFKFVENDEDRLRKTESETNLAWIPSRKVRQWQYAVLDK